MQLNLTGHHIDITPPLREYVTSKMSRVQQHFDQISGIHCILTVEKLQHKAEATIDVRGAKVYADATADDMYAAIDSMTDKITAPHHGESPKYRSTTQNRFQLSPHPLP